MNSKPDIPRYFEPVLQGIAHWVNYKAQYYDGHLLSEGALIGELTQLFSAAVSPPLHVRCERQYKSFGVTQRGQQRVDLAIGELVAGQNDQLRPEGLVAIEVKRYAKNTWRKIEEDLRKLCDLKSAHKGCRAFQLLIGQTDRPDRIFNTNHEMIRKAVFKENGYQALPRMSRKSFHTKRTSERGAYAALLEILPP
jgi:hypothetical protein